MTVSPLSIQQIVAVIRQQMVAPVNLNAGAPAIPTTRTRKGMTASGTGKDARQVALRGLVVRRIEALNPTDPDRGRKAFRIFLECVLINELGDTLINDPHFYQMVDEIQLTMEQDSQIAAAMRDAVNQLLSNGRSTHSNGARR